MVERLHRWLGRAEIRILSVLTCGILSAGLVVSLAQRANTSSDRALPRVSRWDDLLKGYLLFREHNYPLVAPDDCLPYGKLEAVLNEVSAGELQEQHGWYWTFDGGEFVVEAGSELAKQLGERADLVVYEDMENGEILILRAPEKEGEDYREELVYRAPEWREAAKGEDTEIYLWRELSKRRIAWQVTLKTRKLAEEEEAAEESDPLLLKTSGEDLLLRFGEDYTNHLWLSVEGPNHGLTNVAIGIHVPDGFTNRLEVFAITNLLSFPWSMVETNLSADGTNVVYWADASQDDWETCFYAVGNADSDTDEDGITGAREKFLYGTDPQNEDTDGDGASDGDELAAATNPLVNPGDRDGDGLSDDLEVVLGTDPDEADSDGDWVSDGHEYEQGTDPLDDEDAPDLRLVVNDGAMYAISTNLELRIHGLVAEELVLAESPALENAITNACSEVSIFSLPNDSNGVRSVCAVAIRGGTNVGFAGVASIILDTSPPSLQVTNLANESVTANRWVPIQGVATDAVSSVGVWINGGWADGVSSGSFWKTRFVLSPGTNVVTLTAKDAAGNCITQEWTVVQDLSLDSVAPTMDFGLPSDFVVDGGTTNWNFGVTTFGDEAKLGFVGGIDDETALVDVWVESPLGTNGPYNAAVGAKTQVWAEVTLFEGSNQLVGLASDAAGNVSTCTWTVVRDTSFVFRITSPEPYATVNGPSVDVTCVASLWFSNAQVTVNGQATYLVSDSNTTFRTLAAVPLSDGVTKLTACAILNGRSYYADPTARCEITQWTATDRFSWSFMGLIYGSETPHSSGGWWEDGSLWDNVSRMRTETTIKNYWIRRWNGSMEYYMTPWVWSGYSAAWPGGATRFGSQRIRWQDYSGSASQMHQWNGELRFVKMFMQSDKELVLLQFPNLDYGRPAGQPINPAAITYRGQPGFWYNGNVTFVAEIERDTEYVVTALDFVWPPYSAPAAGPGWFWDESGRWLEIRSVSNHTTKVDIEQDVVFASVNHASIRLNLTPDSYWPTGDVTWSSTPAGLGGVTHDNTGFSFDPGSSAAGCYIIQADAMAGGTTLSDTCIVYIIKVEITPASMNATEGLDSGTFTCTVTPSGLNPTYQWLTGESEDAWPSGVGNNPELDYSAQTASSTKISETRWFANPDDRHWLVTGSTCTYSINCEVTVNGVSCRAQSPAQLVVTADASGSTSWPQFSGVGTIQVSTRLVGANTEWYVSGQGSFSRTAPGKTINVPATSQFYNKVDAHESKHVTQWTSEAPWKDLFDANALYVATLQSLTSLISEADLRNKINQAVQLQNATDAQVAVDTKCDREIPAFAVDRAVEPHYQELDDSEVPGVYNCTPSNP